MFSNIKARLKISGNGHKKIAPNSAAKAYGFNEAILTFRAPEYDYHEKSSMWYAIAGGIALLFIIYGLKTDGWSFSLAVIVFAGTYYLVRRKAPPVVDVKITKMGVAIGDHKFQYSGIKGFWIVFEPPHVTKLYLRMAGRASPDISVSLKDTDPSEVRMALKKHARELEISTEPFSDTLVRLFKL